MPAFLCLRAEREIPLPLRAKKQAVGRIFLIECAKVSMSFRSRVPHSVSGKCVFSRVTNCSDRSFMAVMTVWSIL